MKVLAKNYCYRVRFLILAIGCFMLLSSCSLLSPAKPAQNTYVLGNMPEYIPTKRTHSFNLMVMFPETSSAYNTTQMAYNIKPYEIAYFSRNSWIGTPAQMLQPLIVQTMARTHYFHAVVSPSFVGHYDYVLTTQILKLQENFLYFPPCYELKLRVQLIKMATNQILAAKDISISEPVPEATPYGGVIAANRATAKALAIMAVFVQEKIK